MKPLIDTDPMPFGYHKGKLMQDVPASYLVWLKENDCSHPGVLGYIKESWSALKAECPDHIFNEDR